MDEGGIAPLVRLIKSPNVEVQRQSTKALANLAVNGASFASRRAISATWSAPPPAVHRAIAMLAPPNCQMLTLERRAHVAADNKTKIVAMGALPGTLPRLAPRAAAAPVPAAALLALSRQSRPRVPQARDRAHDDCTSRRLILDAFQMSSARVGTLH